MNLHELCFGGKCGMCCFPFFKENGYELNSSSQNFLDFLEKYNDNIDNIQGRHYAKLNCNAKLIVNEFDRDFYACSFLEININNDYVDSMLCSIYENDSRPIVCKNHYPSDFECSPFFCLKVDSLKVMGKFFCLPKIHSSSTDKNISGKAIDASQ